MRPDLNVYLPMHWKDYDTHSSFHPLLMSSQMKSIPDYSVSISQTLMFLIIFLFLYWKYHIFKYMCMCVCVCVYVCMCVYVYITNMYNACISLSVYVLLGGYAHAQIDSLLVRQPSTGYPAYAGFYSTSYMREKLEFSSSWVTKLGKKKKKN